MLLLLLRRSSSPHVYRFESESTMYQSVNERIEALAVEAEDQHMCFAPHSRCDKEALSLRVAKNLYISPYQGLYARTQTWNSLEHVEKMLWIARSLSRLHPEWVFCLHTAAAFHGLYVSNHLTRCVHVAHESPKHPKSRGMIIHHKKKTVESVLIDRVPVTPLLETVIDCLSHSSFIDGLPIADSALAKFDISKRQFLDLMESSRQRGAMKALNTAKHANAKSENGGESIARAVMIEEGFMPPELQVPIRHPLYPGKAYRVDFLWRIPNESPVAGEFDGAIKLENEDMLKNHSVAQTLREERTREAMLTSTGLRVMRFTYDDVRRRYPLTRLMEHYGIPRVA